jgi:hypothetical protein
MAKEAGGEADQNYPSLCASQYFDVCDRAFGKQITKTEGDALNRIAKPMLLGGESASPGSARRICDFEFVICDLFVISVFVL